MERRNFIKKLAIGSAVGITAPMIVKKLQENDDSLDVEIEPIDGNKPILVTYDISQVPRGFSLVDIIHIWKETGVLIYDSTPYK